MFEKVVLITIFLELFCGGAMAQDLEAGEKLFMRKCYMCHRLSDGTKVGPGLLGVTQRRSEKWLHEWLENPKEMLAKGDPVAVELVAKYKKVMSKISAMKKEQNRIDVIAFLKENDKKKGEQ